MRLKPVSIKQLVEWNAIVFVLTAVAFFGTVAFLFMVGSQPPNDAPTDLLPYLHSSNEETRKLVYDCVRNENLVRHSLTVSRLPAGLILTMLGVLALVWGLGVVFTVLLYRRWQQTGQV